METKIDPQTLIDFSNGNYSYNDYLRIKDWFAHARIDKEIENQLFDQWKELAATTSIDEASLRPVFEKIQYKILLDEKLKGKSRNLWYWYRQVAAFLIPVVAVSSLLYILFVPKQTKVQSWVELSAPEGSRVEFLLPDSSSGWLNSGAKLKYPAVFDSHRKVQLTGEAFFSVRHKEKSDFTVSVPDMDIKVLGTKFNVAAYTNETVSEVVLNEGKVEVNGKTATFSKLLLPGEKLTFDHESKALNTRKVDADLCTSWKEGYLVIDNESLEQAVKKLERWYNVDISIQGEKLKNLRFRGTFKEEPLEEVMRFIAMTTPIVYSIERKGYDTNGILAKRKITIKLRS